MIKKLRRRMILINMLLVGTVILAIFIAVIYNNYSNSVNMMERGMNQVLDKQGKQFGDRREPFPEELFGGENNFAAQDNNTQTATVGTGSQPQASAPAATPNEPSAEPAAPGENGQFKKDFHREFGDETPIEISSYVIAHQFDPHFAAAVCRQHGGHLRHQPDFVQFGGQARSNGVGTAKAVCRRRVP